MATAGSIVVDLLARTGSFVTDMDRARKKVKETGDDIRSLSSLAVKAGAALGLAFSVKALVNYADAWSDMQSTVGAAINDMKAAPDLMRRIVDIANASYSPLQQTVDIYTRNVGVLKELGYSANQAANYTESLNHMLVLTSTKGQQAEAVQSALAKAMAIGKLSGQGLETVLTSGGEVAAALAKELKTNVNNLRALAAQGKITSSVMANALLKSLDDVRVRAGKMPATISDALTRIQTNVTEFIGLLDQASGASGTIASGLIAFADGIRVAGGYVLAFGQLVAPAFSAAGEAIASLSEYSGIALAAIGGFAAPALAAGVWALASALAAGVGGAIAAITAAMMANPVGLFIGALSAGVYAAYKFRDNIQEYIGVDVVEVLKQAANFTIGAFVTAFNELKFVWDGFGSMMGSAVIGGVNIAIRAINSLIQGAMSGIDGMISLVNNIPGVDIGLLGDSVGIGELDNPYSNRLSLAYEELKKANNAAMSKDYVGGLWEGVKGLGAAPPSALPPEALPNSKATGGKASIDEGQRLINQMQERIALLGKETEYEQLLAKIGVGSIKFKKDGQKELALELAKTIDIRAAEIEQEKTLKELREQQSVTQRQFMRELEALGQGDWERSLNSALARTEDKYQQLIQSRRNSPMGLSDTQLSAIESSLQKELGMVRKHYAEMKAEQSNWQLGAKDALVNYRDDAANVYESIGSLATNAFKGMEDALVGFVKNGKLSFKDLTDSIISDMMRMMIQQSVTGPLAGALSAGIGALVGSIGSGPAITAAPSVDLSHSVGQFSFSSGGFTGVGGRFEPAGVVHKGEGVLNQDEIRAIGGESGFNALRRAIRGVGHSLGGMGGLPRSAPSIFSAEQRQQPSVIINSNVNASPGTDVAALSATLDDRDAQLRYEILEDLRRGRVEV